MPEKQTMSTPVIKLRNIGQKLATRLNEVGIYTREDLQQAGAVEAHRQIRSLYPYETLAVCYYLYSFEGALTDQRWNDIPAHRKTALKQALEGKNHDY